MAISVESAELLEVFQYLKPEESDKWGISPENLTRAKEEIADIFCNAIRFADELGINLIEAAHAKIKINEQKYPIDLAKGNAVKYNQR